MSGSSAGTHHGGMVADLTGDALDGFDAALSYRGRRASMSRRAGAAGQPAAAVVRDRGHQRTAPKRRRWARSLERRFTEVEMPDPSVRRCCATSACARGVLRPKSGRVADQRPAALREYLTAHHPDVISLPA
ncbi:hypothetical protein [Mycobacterium kubicae]|uniref:hypothetical protein n=1 Tax=Mycobacterium kubicae TaxID=120959 RepID=UPI00164176D9|nr:hypothetical protein [Mycobacterium kubicae]QNI11041.1 hypothetical protein GAN18_07300 [Mycobacterium kubicae]